MLAVGYALNTIWLLTVKRCVAHVRIANPYKFHMTLISNLPRGGEQWLIHK